MQFAVGVENSLAEAVVAAENSPAKGTVAVEVVLGTWACSDRYVQLTKHEQNRDLMLRLEELKRLNFESKHIENRFTCASVRRRWR